MVMLPKALLGLSASLLLLAESRGLAPVSADSATMEAIRALDTDHSGKVEKSEVEAFAKSQGLSAAEVRAEFADLDTNGNGELEADEISNTLNQGAPSPEEASTVEVALKKPSEPFLDVTATKAKKEQARTAAPAAPTAVKALSAAESHTAPAPSGLSSLDGHNFNLKALELDAQQHAGKALAEVFARTAARALEEKGEDNAKADKLEQAARALRGQTADLKQRAATETVNAATAAAAAVLKEASAKVKDLEDQAQSAEAEAATRRSQAKEAMDRALKMRSDMQLLQHS
jgi:hypothetical protein